MRHRSQRWRRTVERADRRTFYASWLLPLLLIVMHGLSLPDAAPAIHLMPITTATHAPQPLLPEGEAGSADTQTREVTLDTGRHQPGHAEVIAQACLAIVLLILVHIRPRTTASLNHPMASTDPRNHRTVPRLIDRPSPRHLLCVMRT